MNIKNVEDRHIPPTHPGEMLREDFMPDFGLTSSSLAAKLGVSRQTINELTREKRSITPAMALRLSTLFGNSPHFWLNAQHNADLWKAKYKYKDDLAQIESLKAA